MTDRIDDIEELENIEAQVAEQDTIDARRAAEGDEGAGEDAAEPARACGGCRWWVRRPGCGDSGTCAAEDLPTTGAVMHADAAACAAWHPAQAEEAQA